MSGRVFTAADLARVAGLSLELTEVVLVDFAKQGLVVRQDEGYEATVAGLKLSRALTMAAPEGWERERGEAA